MRYRSCYLCQSNSFHKLYEINNFNLVKCTNCGFIYVNNFLTKNNLDYLYNDFEYKNISLSENRIRDDANHSLRVISKYCFLKKRLFDIGCGAGFFMDEARKMGWETYGIDYSKSLVDYASKKLKLDVEKKDIYKFSTHQKFSVITLNQVIEHMFNPITLIRKCKMLLEKNGLIYVSTPNIESMASHVNKQLFDYIIPPEHLGYFSSSTLIKLLESLDFRVLFIGSWSYPEDLAGIIRRLLVNNNNKMDHKNKNILLNQEIHTKCRNIKTIKNYLFDKLFCRLFYKFLNMRLKGTNLEIIGYKL